MRESYSLVRNDGVIKDVIAVVVEVEEVRLTARSGVDPGLGEALMGRCALGYRAEPLKPRR